MNFACPHCSADLNQRTPRKASIDGQKTGAFQGRSLVCPACGQALAFNHHPAEKAFFPGIIVAVVGLNVYSLATGVKVSMTGALVLLGVIFAATYVVKNLIPPKDWPRYQPFKRPGGP